MRTILVSLIASAAILSTAQAQKTGSATAIGNCNIVISGNSNTLPVANLRSDRCGLAKDQADKIVKLLNAVYTKRDAAQVNVKLDELIELASKPSEMNCVGSNCVQNGTQNNYDDRTYGVPKPLPNIVGLSQTQIAATPRPADPPKPRPGMPQNDTQYFPGVTVTFSVDAPFANPMFVVYCDRPCRPVRIFFVDAQGMGGFAGSGFPFLGTNHPNIWVTEYGMQNMLTPGRFAQVELRSLDSEPISIVRVEPYAQ